jgi:peptidoglycan/xylan/chitin deacetylase (PgdA/CDA1 family)
MKAHDSLTSRVGAGAALAGGAALCAYLLPAIAGLSTDEGAPVLPWVRRALGVEDRTRSGRGYALTFDDGPHPEGTPAVLAILAQARVRATFFLVGEQVRRSPSLVAEILACGHEIGLHCDRHRNLARLTPWQVRADIESARDAIGAAGGREVGLYRPPYGVLNAAALSIARARGWRTLLWSRWGRDWAPAATPTSIAARVSAHAREGEVLLLHDADDYSAPGSWRKTAQALPRVLEAMSAAGIQVADL